MKFYIFLAIVASASLTLAAPLKSTKLRKEICNDLVKHIEDEGLRLTYEDDWGNKLAVLPEFEKSCVNSKSAFQVTASTYNKKALSKVELTIKIDLALKNQISFSGTAKFKRSAFDPNSGEVKLSKWTLTTNNLKYSLNDEVIKKLADVIADTANIHNGGAGLGTFNPDTYTVAKVTKEINLAINKSNGPNSGRCNMLPVEDEAWWMIRESEDKSHGPVLNILNLLKERGLILGVFGSEGEEWRESCAYYDIYIYLKNGTLITIDYDFTT